MALESFFLMGAKPLVEDSPTWKLHQLIDRAALGMNLLKAHRKLQRMQQPMPQGTSAPA